MAPKAASKSSKKDKAPKEKRQASLYNVFMKTEIDRLKKANPSQTAKERFKLAALNWKSAPENPKNKK